MSSLVTGEGALREVMSARLPDGMIEPSPSLALTIFQWNLSSLRWRSASGQTTPPL